MLKTKHLNFLMVLSLCVFYGLVILMHFYSFLNTPVHFSTEINSFEVPVDMPLKSIANQLKTRGIIDNAFYFSLYIRLLGKQNEIKPGEYLLDAELTPKTLAKVMIEGRIIQYKLTVPEGWTFKKMLDVLYAQPQIVASLKNRSELELVKILALSHHSLEGFFFPDTYYFYKGMTDKVLLETATDRMKKVLAEEWEKRDLNLPYKNSYQALVMASIVEKETGAKEERTKIAGVFVRRLQKGMLLQTDPSVIYGLKGLYQGDLTDKNLKIETPYNTYLNHGLPPTPICLPGRQAIHAALHPDLDNTLYFVAKGNGTHVFSATLEEHNRAVYRYQVLPMKSKMLDKQFERQ